MKDKNEQQQTLMQKLLRASGPQNDLVRKMTAEFEEIDLKIDAEQFKVQKWVEDKQKIDEEVKNAMLAEESI
ncbi:hypothetical protein BU25DRAFT_457103 [Macroventuria anomochaeta]|uniref:Uncharacterized protein n=1 Tax=Macroventuria anomochaeta TaxID=301207 RepID=A0ACB6S5J3_9PLEO|nr:uncharacterized protein BU25DRAFT_457103 [Macroventuria anomochaeta]KAF2629441.1 hypothetical protein BU25DRAFT_457103 [Macroventuria anomochaeta]